MMLTHFLRGALFGLGLGLLLAALLLQALR